MGRVPRAGNNEKGEVSVASAFSSTFEARNALTFIIHSPIAIRPRPPTMATASSFGSRLTAHRAVQPWRRTHRVSVGLKCPGVATKGRGVKSNHAAAAADVPSSTKSESTSSSYDLGCPHFETCPGCSLDTNLHIPPTLSKAEEWFKDKGVEDFKAHTASTNGWRTRAKLAVRSVGNDARKNKPPPLALGLFQKGTHDLVEIPECVVHHPSINKAAEWVTEIANKLNVAAYDETTGLGKLRYVQLTVAGDENDTTDPNTPSGVQIAIVWNSKPPVEGASVSPALVRYVDALYLGVDGDTSDDSDENKKIVHSVWVNYNDSNTNEIISVDVENWAHVHGPRYIYNKHGDASVAYAPGSFLQANTEAYNALLSSLRKDIPVGSKITELYAGTGAIGLSIAASPIGKHESFGLRCVEVVAAAQETFVLSCEKTFPGIDASNQPNVSFEVASAGDAAQNSVIDTDVIVVDPPRKGLDRKTLASLAGYEGDTSDGLEPANLDPRKGKQGPAGSGRKKRNKRNRREKKKSGNVPVERLEKIEPPPGRLKTLIYVSCGFASFQRDCAYLLNSGEWELKRAEGFNFFPGSDALETLAVFTRKE